MAGSDDAVADGSAAAAGGEATSVEDLTGIWIKDKEASDPPDAMFELMQLPALFRLGVNLMKGLEVKATADSFEFQLVSGLLGFRLGREAYPLTGQEVEGSRRDRRGPATARAERSPRGGVVVRSRWGEPYAGSAEEHFYLDGFDPSVLHKDNVLTVGDRTAHINVIFQKQA